MYFLFFKVRKEQTRRMCNVWIQLNSPSLNKGCNKLLRLTKIANLFITVFNLPSLYLSRTDNFFRPKFKVSFSWTTGIDRAIVSFHFYGVRFLHRSRDSDWLRAGRSSGPSLSPGRVKNFLFSTSSGLALGSTQPPIQWVPGALSPREKRPGREADHSLPASAEAKKMWIYTCTPPYAFMA
jgi:hypothetical protein